MLLFCKSHWIFKQMQSIALTSNLIATTTAINEHKTSNLNYSRKFILLSFFEVCFKFLSFEFFTV